MVELLSMITTGQNGSRALELAYNWDRWECRAQMPDVMVIGVSSSSPHHTLVQAWRQWDRYRKRGS